MPGVVPPPDDFMAGILNGLQAQIDAIARQQNSIISDSQNRIRAQLGLQSDGTIGLWFFDTSGNPVVKLGDLGMGIYGLSVRNPAGNMQYVAGSTTATAGGPLTCSSTSLVALSGGPTVVVQVGPSGILDVALSALIQPGSYSAGESAWLYPVVGGILYTWPHLQVSVGSSSSFSSTAYGEAQITGLTPGALYTCSTQAAVSTSGVAANYSDVTLAVTPV